MSKDKRPDTFIQWKGTDVCVDIYCTCGEQCHFDGMFMYYVRCPHCQAAYQVGSRVSLTRLSEAEERALGPLGDDTIKVGT